MNRGKPTKAQLRRMEILKREVGCLACMIEGAEWPVLADYHHAYNRPKNVAKHDWGYPLCPYHHRGIGAGIGPSIAANRRAFADRYGSEGELVLLADEKAAEFERQVNAA